MSKLETLAAQLEQKRGELAKIFADHSDGNGGYKDTLTANIRDEINRRNDELTQLGSDYEGERKLAEIEKQNAAELARAEKCHLPAGVKHNGPAGNGGRPQEAPQAKSLGELICESQAIREYKEYKNRSFEVKDVELKTLMTTAAGWAPESLRTGRLVLSAQEQPRVVDVMPMTETGYAAVKYMEETTFTNNAAEASEGGTYGEAALVLTERSVTIQKIAVWLPVTDEELEDVARLRDYINNRLLLMLKMRLDSQLVAGDGSTPNILGILNKGSINTQAKGTDPTPDAFYKAMVTVMATGKADPSAILIHPLDWQDVRLLRTADGIYIWGNPADAGPDRMWGLPVIKSTNVTQNTGIVGDFLTHAELCYRRGIDVKVSDSHSTFFVEGKQAIRADFRCASIWRRAAAFTKVTGI